MTDFLEALDDVGVDMCQCPCDAAGAVRTAEAHARLLGGGGGGGGSDNIAMSAHVLCAAAFFVMLLFCLWRVMEPLPRIQIMCLRTRLYWCIKANVFVCTMSCFLSVLHCTNFEFLIYKPLGFPNSGLIKPLEYIVTCPVMMLILVVMAGEAVPAKRQYEVMACTTCILCLGFAAQMSTTLPVKMMFYISGLTFFVVLMSRVEKCVRQHSSGKESLFSGGFHGSAYKKMCLKTAMTWVLFPIWFILSPEGLGVVQDYTQAILITSALNIYSKAFYVVYVVIIYDIYVGEDTLLSKPKNKGMSHQDHGAAEQAARLGPNEAIACLEKSMKKNQESINQIRKLMIRDEQNKEERLRREQQLMQEMASGENKDEIMTPQTWQGMTPNPNMMYTGASGTIMQGMIDPPMMGATQPDMSNFQAEMGGMNQLSRAPSSIGSARQPMLGMQGVPPRVPTLPLNGTNGYVSGMMGPDVTAPGVTQPNFQQTGMHAAAAPMSMGSNEVQTDMAKAAEQYYAFNAMNNQAQVQYPPMQHHQVQQMYANQMYQQQQQQQQQTAQMAEMGGQSSVGKLSPRSVTSSMPDPDQKYRINPGAPNAVPCNGLRAGIAAPPSAPDTGFVCPGGIGVGGPLKEADGMGSSNWRQVAGFVSPGLREPKSVPVPSAEQ